MEKPSKAKGAEKRSVGKDSLAEQRGKNDHPEGRRENEAGVVEERSEGNTDAEKKGKAKPNEEMKKDVPFSKETNPPETKMLYKLSSIEHELLNEEEKENESEALEALTPELVKNITPPGSKLSGTDALKMELRTRELPVSGTKKELVDRLREDQKKDQERYRHKEKVKGFIPV